MGTDRDAMSEVSRLLRCSPQQVFDVLADGWTYATWVVGAARIRRVDDGFPAPGSRVHHSVGLWPLLINDHTEVEEIDPPRQLRLRVKAWPTGEGHVILTCEPHPEGTLVTMREGSVSGPVSLLPDPLERKLLDARNTETLKRLAYLAESRGAAG